MKKPNIILVSSRGHRADCLGCAGNVDARTPNLDALAMHGLRFDHVWRQGGSEDEAFPALLRGTSDAKDTLLFSEALSKAGYTVGCISTATLPAKDNTKRMASYLLNDAYRESLRRPAENHHGRVFDDAISGPYPEVASAAPTASEPVNQAKWVGDQAIHFLRTAREPVFLWAGFTCPGFHASTAGPESKLTQRQHLATYLGSIALLDRQVGRILATLAARGLTNNILVYCSTTVDTPTLVGGNDLSALSERQLRVPLIVAGVKGQRRGEVEHTPASTEDVVPTLRDLARLSSDASLPGASLAKCIRSGKGLRRKALCVHDGDTRAIRDERYKLVIGQGNQVKALYDLVNAPHETENLMDSPDAEKNISRLRKAGEARS